MRATVLDTNDRYSATARSAPPRATAMTAGSATPDPDAVVAVALEALRFEHAHAEAARSRSILAMALYVGALGVLGAQVMLIAVVHLLGI